MSIKDLQNINWETVAIEDLIRAHELMGMSFEFNNGKLTKIYINPEELE